MLYPGTNVQLVAHVPVLWTQCAAVTTTSELALATVLPEHT